MMMTPTPTTTATTATTELLPSSSTRAATAEQLMGIVAMIRDATASSPHTQRAYLRALHDFLAWYGQSGYPTLTRAVVRAYMASLRERGVPLSSRNQRLVAIRKLADEAYGNNLIDDAIAASIRSLHGERQEGKRTGRWLTKHQAQALLDAPDTATLLGLRDRAILALFLGSGMRRSELASLTIEHIQQRDGRWVIVDLRGKRGKIRTVPLAAWAKVAIDEYVVLAGVTSGYLFRPTRDGGNAPGARGEDGKPTPRALAPHISPQTAWSVVRDYSTAIGVPIAPHDMRRTFSLLAIKGGSSLEQLQYTLGHSSIKQTQDYVGMNQDLTDAPADHVGLRVRGLV